MFINKRNTKVLFFCCAFFNLSEVSAAVFPTEADIEKAINEQAKEISSEELAREIAEAQKKAEENSQQQNKEVKPK